MTTRDLGLLAAALMLAIGCAGSTQGGGGAQTPPVRIEETVMIDTIAGLCRQLSRDPVSIEDVAASLGEVVAGLDEGPGLAVRPRDAGFASALVVPMPDTRAPAVVQLELVGAGTLQVKHLSAAFGSYRALRVHGLGAPPRVGFRVDDAGLPYTCMVMADVKPGPDGVADGDVIAIEVRRDPRLD